MLNKAKLYIHLPIFTALLLETHIRFLPMKIDDGMLYISIFLQLAVEFLPFFVAHHFAYTHTGKRAWLAWPLGFVVYPLVTLSISAQSVGFEQWSLFTPQAAVLSAAASIAVTVIRIISRRHKTRSLTFISRLFSLNSVVILLGGGWAIIMAGVFNTHEDPLFNQPLNLVIDIGILFSEFGRFANYLWQFIILALLVGIIYVINRYVLIRQCLAKQGVLTFLMAALVTIIVLTPILASIALWLPIHIPEFSLIPSANYRVFDPDNFQFVFWIITVSTPLILAFERQQQDKTIAQIAQQQTQTELKLLQQQINPHFLFNTLNNLYALTLTKSDDAPELVMQLSNLLRYAVYEGQNENVTLAQEVNYLQDYVSLQQIRNHDKCNLDIVWPKDADKYLLPPLLIIILLENAFKYGVETATGKSEITFHMALNNNVLRVSCINTLVTTAKAEVGGVGLENLRRRLSLLFPNKHSLVSELQNGKWVAEMSLELTPC